MEGNMMVASIRNLYIVMFIGVVCGLQSILDDCPYNTTLCVCDFAGYDIQCVGLPEIPPLDVHSVLYYMAITLQDGNITTIVKGSLPPDLVEVHIIGHPLTNLSDDAFDNSAATLEYVQVSGAKFTEIPRALLNLTMLHALDIVDTPIQDWDDSRLQRLSTNITFLRLSNVNLTTWPSWISYFHMLYTLDLSRNRLESIPDSAFKSLKNSLTTLSLANTGLTHVPQSITLLTSLTSLDLRDNKFVEPSELEKLALFPVKQDFSSPTVYLLSVGLTIILNFSNMTHLKEIYLDNNNISDDTAGFFPATVTEVSLTENQLSSVPRAIFNMSRLAHLNISRNHISAIATSSLPRTLASLDLSYNTFTTITNTTFSNLHYLYVLYLSNNPISTISPSAFADLTWLQYLYLDHTSLTEIPLALSQLSFSIMQIHLENIPSLSCPCPMPTELNTWYNRKDHTIFLGVCEYGQPINDYFVVNHRLVPSTTTTSSLPVTTPSGHAPGREIHFFIKYGSLALVSLTYVIFMG